MLRILRQCLKSLSPITPNSELTCVRFSSFRHAMKNNCKDGRWKSPSLRGERKWDMPCKHTSLRSRHPHLFLSGFLFLFFFLLFLFLFFHQMYLFLCFFSCLPTAKKGKMYKRLIVCQTLGTIFNTEQKWKLLN